MSTLKICRSYSNQQFYILMSFYRSHNLIKKWIFRYLMTFLNIKTLSKQTIFHLNAYFVSHILWLKNGIFDFQ